MGIKIWIFNKLREIFGPFVLARTEFALFGPGQFILCLAKTKIPVFGPGGNLKGWERLCV